ncbi:hypothetical protein [Paraburkholderia bryophila]|uniref:Uncharacterized protein n=1 Tax=Paraburkholderia bryophila TaxID=420952 RepID=A0A7Y9WMN0_9BURK|nr:hypothetical protein [Paraburkholderia bryophila]NYH23682.1 hypothetical protein [Paraburkholderia bryophila]
MKQKSQLDELAFALGEGTSRGFEAARDGLNEGADRYAQAG